MTGRDGQDGARATGGDAYTGGAAEATAPVYTIRSLRANLREALATVRETGVPAIIAERGERPVAVLVAYASWAAQHGGDDGMAMEIAAAAGPSPDSASEPRPAAEQAQSLPGLPPPLPAGWGGASPTARPNTDGQAGIPAGWRVATGGWGV